MSDWISCFRRSFVAVLSAVLDHQIVPS